MTPGTRYYTEVYHNLVNENDTWYQVYDTRYTSYSVHLMYTWYQVYVVVLTLTHNTIQCSPWSQDRLQSITLEWKKYLGSKTEAKTIYQVYNTPCVQHTCDRIAHALGCFCFTTGRAC